MDSVLLLSGAGFLAGAMNALAGGGSFVTLPALVAAGMPSAVANQSSTIALFPGSLASAWAYRAGLAGVGSVTIARLAAVSLVGGLAGALLLLATPERSFDLIVPWLLLLATLAFAAGRRAGAALRRVFRIGEGPVLFIQFALAVYGGYFGGAVGIMMMAVWSLLDAADVKAMNPARTLLVAATNAVAVLCFAVAGDVRWLETSIVLVAAAVGGYAGARLGLRMNPGHVRAAVLLVSTAITTAFFLRAA